MRTVLVVGASVDQLAMIATALTLQVALLDQIGRRGGSFVGQGGRLTRLRVEKERGLKSSVPPLRGRAAPGFRPTGTANRQGGADGGGRTHEPGQQIRANVCLAATSAVCATPTCVPIAVVSSVSPLNPITISGRPRPGPSDDEPTVAVTLLC
jgi:hypothetical protein